VHVRMSVHTAGNGACSLRWSMPSLFSG
jgi:hypothetical protein